jgi:hypothetical protein
MTTVVTPMMLMTMMTSGVTAEKTLVRIAW